MPKDSHEVRNWKPSQLAKKVATLATMASMLFVLGGCPRVGGLTPEGKYFGKGLLFNFIDREIGINQYERNDTQTQNPNISYIPKYEIGDMYITPMGANKWIRVKENLWITKFKDGEEVTANDYEVTNFSRYSGLPIIRRE